MMQMVEFIFWAMKCHSLRRVLLQILTDLQRAAGLSQYSFMHLELFRGNRQISTKVNDTVLLLSFYLRSLLNSIKKFPYSTAWEHVWGE